MSALSPDDIKFLIELQKEMNTQDTDCQADPRYWVVAENKREYGFDSDYADGICFCSHDGDTWDSSDEFIKHLVENEEIEEDDVTNLSSLSPEDIIDSLDSSNYFICGYRNCYDIPSPNTMFLTKKSCKKHIESNNYHYSEPHSYAMTAWRNYEMYKLYEIIQKTDWHFYINT